MWVPSGLPGGMPIMRDRAAETFSASARPQVLQFAAALKWNFADRLRTSYVR